MIIEGKGGKSTEKEVWSGGKLIYSQPKEP